jgi:hypothetical protein
MNPDPTNIQIECLGDGIRVNLLKIDTSKMLVQLL